MGSRSKHPLARCTTKSAPLKFLASLKGWNIDDVIDKKGCDIAYSVQDLEMCGKSHGRKTHVSSESTRWDPINPLAPISTTFFPQN